MPMQYYYPGAQQKQSPQYAQTQYNPYGSLPPAYQYSPNAYADIYGANSANQASQQRAMADAFSNVLSSAQNAYANIYGSDAALAGQRYRSDADLLAERLRQLGESERAVGWQGTNRDIEGMRQTGETERERIGADVGRYGYDRSLQAALAQAAASQYGSGADLYGRLAGTQAERDIAGLNSGTAMGVENIRAGAQTLPSILQQRRFERIAPLLMALIGKIGSRF